MRLGKRWLRISITVSRAAMTRKNRHASSTSQNPKGLAVQSSASRRITIGCYRGLGPGPDCTTGYTVDMGFRNLCRSSPWRWTSLRFEYLELPGTGAAMVRAWLRRPGALRLESPDGKLLYSTTGINDSKDEFYVSSTRRSHGSCLRIW